jgi:hypothetical protein
MADDDNVRFYAPQQPVAPLRQPKPGEPLWAFVRESGKTMFECKVRFHGESYGWEAQIFEQGELLGAHGGFVTRALAAQWAVLIRKSLDRDGCR